MWLNETISQNMFIEKVKNQTLELESARKRNTELLKKCQHLEQEHNKLHDMFKSNQVEIITKKNKLNELLADLKNQKRLNITAAQSLEIRKEQINVIQECLDETNDGMFNPLTELQPIKEKLSFKWDVVECLQNKLFETRLKTAENEATIAELKQQEKDFKNEIELLKTSGKETIPISRLQEEFLAARLKEADVVLEFDKLKRSLAIIKQEIEEKKLETELEMNRENQDYFHIHFNLRDKYHEQLKAEEETSIAKTVELQNEIDYLKMQIKKLEEIKQDILSRVYFNEEKTKKELEKIIEKNNKLEEKMFRDMTGIQNRIDDKDLTISQLAKEIKNLQLYNESCAKCNEESMTSMNEDTMNKLEEDVQSLEEKIKTLSCQKI